MRKSFITKHYSLENVAGTYNIEETRNFLSSKVMEIPDNQTISNNIILWYESSDNTQNIGVDDIKKVFNPEIEKFNNTKIYLSENQTEDNKREYALWNLDINLYEIYKSYSFANIKKEKTFAYISNTDTIDKKVDNMIYDYIEKNVYSKIYLNNISIYLKYYKVGDIQENSSYTYSGNSTIQALKYETLFQPNLVYSFPNIGESNEAYNIRILSNKTGLLLNNYNQTLTNNNKNLSITFKQKEIASKFKFDYYFELNFKKI